MLAPSVARKVFSIYENISETYINNTFLELKKNEKKSIDQIENDSLLKLNRLLIYAVQHSPYYEDKIPVSLPGEINNFDVLQQMPYLDKTLLRDNVNSITSRKPVAKLTLAKTSGSTGAPLRFPKDAFVRAYHYAAMYRGHSWYDLAIGDREARLWGVPVKVKDRFIISCKDYLLNRFREKDFNLSESSLDHFYKLMLRNKPAYIMGYGKMLFGFTSYLRKNNLDLSCLSMKMAKYTSENVDESDKEVIREAFGCPVVSEYGAAETGILTFQCPSGGHHIMSDCVHLEYLDQPGLELNNVKEIVVTDLHSLSFPVIRYRLGDLVEIPERSCSCGLPFPTLNKIIGRTSEMFTVGDSRHYHSLIFYYIVKGLGDVSKLLQFRVIQQEKKKFCYQLSGLNSSTSIEEHLIAKTKQELGDDVIVTVEYLPLLHREKSGKLRDFVPLGDGGMKKGHFEDD